MLHRGTLKVLRFVLQAGYYASGTPHARRTDPSFVTNHVRHKTTCKRKMSSLHATRDGPRTKTSIASIHPKKQRVVASASSNETVALRETESESEGGETGEDYIRRAVDSQRVVPASPVVLRPAGSLRVKCSMSEYLENRKTGVPAPRPARRKAAPVPVTVQPLDDNASDMLRTRALPVYSPAQLVALQAARFRVVRRMTDAVLVTGLSSRKYKHEILLMSIQLLDHSDQEYTDLNALAAMLIAIKYMDDDYTLDRLVYLATSWRLTLARVYEAERGLMAAVAWDLRRFTRLFDTFYVPGDGNDVMLRVTETVLMDIRSCGVPPVVLLRQITFRLLQLPQQSLSGRSAFSSRGTAFNVNRENYNGQEDTCRFRWMDRLVKHAFEILDHIDEWGVLPPSIHQAILNLE